MKNAINQHHLQLREFKLFLLLATLAFCTTTVMAQSGRRTPKAAPTATPSPEPTPSLEKPKPKVKSDLMLEVGMERDPFPTFNIAGYDTFVLNACVDRLKSSGLTVDIAGRDVTRGDAIKRAKAAKEAFVVLLKLSVDAGPTNNAPSLSDLVVEYTVFAPTTAKVVTHGRSYVGNQRVGGISVPVQTGTINNAIYAERLLKQAAEDTAERILDGLHLSSPISRRP